MKRKPKPPKGRVILEGSNDGINWNEVHKPTKEQTKKIKALIRLFKITENLSIEDCTCHISVKRCKFHKQCKGTLCATGINICDNPEHNIYKIAQQEKILEELRKYWKKNPDLRLGQLISNISRENNLEADPFYLDDAYLRGVLLRKNNEKKVNKETFNEKVNRLSKEARR